MKAVLIAAVLLLSACDRGTDPQPTPAPPTPEPVLNQGSAPVGGPALMRETMNEFTLTPDGYGPVRVGMTMAEVERALGGPLQLDGEYSVDPVRCRYGTSPELGGVRVMVENGRVARIDLEEGWEVTTSKGLGLSDTREKVRAAYGTALREQPHKYQGAPAAYLESWNADRSRGVRYEIDEQGQVVAVYAGGPQVNYVEGCA